MNDTLKVAGRIGAELGAAKAENERLRGLLERIRTTCCQVRDAQDLDTAPGLSAAESLHEQIEKLDAAITALAENERLRAEVEMLREDAERWRYVSLQGDDTHWLNLLRVDLEDFGGNINAAVDALIDGEAPAKEATQ